MKFLITALCLLSTSVSFAQKPRTTSSSPSFSTSPSPSASSYNYSSSSFSTKIASISLGMTSSALNIGARMEADTNQAAFGGYFFLQTEKTDAGVPQVMSFGAHTLLKIVDSSTASAYLAPGMGVSMIKGTAGSNDVTAVGPSFRYGGQLKLARGGFIGLEHLEVWNWFDSKALSSAAFTSAVYSFMF